MKTIIITSQKEFDALPVFAEFTTIEIRSSERISVTAWENSQVTAWGNSQVTACGNSQVTARGNSQVTAWENPQVTARENSQVTAWENSQVTAWENSQVTAWGSVSIHCLSPDSTVLLFSFAVAIVSKLLKHKIVKKSKTAYIQKVEDLGWFENNGIKKSKNVILYKKVSVDFKTQENTQNETVWKIGSTLEHPEWNPTIKECGPGKYHACSKPYFCDEFRNKKGDRYIAIQVELKDTHEWNNPEYTHKISFRKGTVLYECDKFGKRI